MIEIIPGDCAVTLATLPAGAFQTCVTSPPYYGLRDYGHAGQIGLEPTPDEYVARLVEVFAGVKRVLRDDGTLWLNLGDSYGRGKRVDNVNDNKRGANANTGHVSLTAAGAYGQGARAHLPEKNLLGIPWRVAFALQADGWWLRSAIVWAKPNPMPESVRDRPTSAYEMVFLLAKSSSYFYDADAIREEGVCDYTPSTKRVRDVGGRGDGLTTPCRVATPEAGRNARNVWTIATQPYSGAHFATMPPDLAERCIKASSKPGDRVLDPFGGAGTTGLVADRLGRHATLCELNPEYAGMARARVADDCPLLAVVA